MYGIVSWRRWRDTVLLGLAAAVGLFAVGKAAAVGFPAMRQTAASAADESVTLPILMYHGVLDDPANRGTYVISPEALESDLRLLRERGYTTVCMADLIAYVDEGAPLPERPVMLTFDDGYYNNYKFAFPLLREYGMKAVLSPVVYWTEFYTGQESDRALYSHATWDELRQMAASGTVEIQNHSYNLHDATGQKTRKGVQKRSGETAAAYQAAMREDIGKAQERLREELGQAPTTFTYPFGALCPEVVPVLEELGFRGTLTCESRLNRITRDGACLWGLGRYLRSDRTDVAALLDRWEKERS